MILESCTHYMMVHISTGTYCTQGKQYMCIHVHIILKYYMYWMCDEMCLIDGDLCKLLCLLQLYTHTTTCVCAVNISTLYLFISTMHGLKFFDQNTFGLIKWQVVSKENQFTWTKTVNHYFVPILKHYFAQLSMQQYLAQW